MPYARDGRPLRLDENVKVKVGVVLFPVRVEMTA